MVSIGLLCVPLREPLLPLGFNFLAWAFFTAKDAELLAERRAENSNIALPP